MKITNASVWYDKNVRGWLFEWCDNGDWCLVKLANINIGIGK